MAATTRCQTMDRSTPSSTLGSNLSLTPPTTERRVCFGATATVKLSADTSACTSGRCSPASQRSNSSSTVPSVVSTGSECPYNHATTDTLGVLNIVPQPAFTAKEESTPKSRRTRTRTISGSKSEDHIMMADNGMRVYTKGRPPWYDKFGKKLKDPFIIGICGGSASGKTTVAEKIITLLEMPWVTVLSMDSFYKINTCPPPNTSTTSTTPARSILTCCAALWNASNRVWECLQGKCVQVPVYDFTTHSRLKHAKVMYGADVIIFEGILAFHDARISEMMDLKIFVDTDSDARLARRLRRDTVERGRDPESVLSQYFSHVKPAFDGFIAPAMNLADIIIPRGGENAVAVDLIAKQIKRRLAERGYEGSAHENGLENGVFEDDSSPMDDMRGTPDKLFLLEQTPQVRGIHTYLRNRDTPRDEFIFYSERLMRLLIEYGLSLLPFESVQVSFLHSVSPRSHSRIHKPALSGVSILRAGETMERALREVVKDCKMGKILIQNNPTTGEPELHYLRLPKNVHEYHVLLMDATVATGAAATMAVRILLDHDVPESNIMLLSILSAETGVQQVAYSFPEVKIATSAIDRHVNSNPGKPYLFNIIIPGLGSFGDRYYGTGYWCDSNTAAGAESDSSDDGQHERCQRPRARPGSPD